VILGRVEAAVREVSTMSANRRRSTRRAPGTFQGDEREVRVAAAAVVAAWDGWSAGPDYRMVLADAVREEIETLRDALADPDSSRFAAAVTALLGGVPVPTAAPGVQAAVQRLRQAAFPPRAGIASQRPPFG
jgi:hypothetical protein